MPIRLGRSEREDEMNKKAPKCFKCGAPMRYHDMDYGEIWKCTNYDCRCKYLVDTISPDVEGETEKVLREARTRWLEDNMDATVGDIY